ncbi:MAG: phage holin family protein [Eubacteriales bacterium]|nr:phage holin family protein [Eubacteriales bacterium]
MNHFWARITKALAVAGGAIMGILGGWSPLLTALIVFMSLDYLTGLVAAARGKSLKTENGYISSRAGFDGLIRKAGIMVVVFMGALLDQALDGESAMFMSASVCYFIANEGISILENLTLLGVKIPEALRAALELMNRKSQGTSQDK